MVNSILLFTSSYLDMQTKNDWSEVFLVKIFGDEDAKWKIVEVALKKTLKKSLEEKKLPLIFHK